MAKGSAMGLWRGKKGSSVFYRIANSSNAQKQGVRERVYEPSNPRSSGQAGQRMKLLPAQRFANMFRSIIDRAFEGVDYGVKSRQKFMSYALKMTSGFPAVDKGDARIWPGRYVVSVGSLPAMTGQVDEQDDTFFITSLPVSDYENTIGSLSQALLSSNAWLREGDQLNFIMVGGLEGATISSTIVLPFSVSFYLNSNSSDSLPTAGGYVRFSASDDKLSLVVDTGINFFVGCAIVVARESDTGGHLRSTSYMTVNPRFDDFLFSEAAKQRARRSYQNQRRLASDWELVPGSGVTVDEESELQEYTISGTSYSDLNGKVCLVWRGLESGNLVAIPYSPGVDGAQYLVSPSGGSVIYETPGEGGLVDENEAVIADVPAFNGIPTVIYQP